MAFWSPGPVEMLLLAVVALLLYGGDLPNVARSWGKSFSEFRRSLTGIQNEINDVIYSEPERLEYRQETSSPYIASPEANEIEAIDVEANEIEAIDTEVNEVEITDTEMPGSEVADAEMTLTEVNYMRQDNLETGESDVQDGPSEVNHLTDAEVTTTPPPGQQPPASAH
jgi:sec-independent protein translocase protein TatA